MAKQAPSKLGDFHGLVDGKTIEIWYQRTEVFRDFNFGDFRAFENDKIEKTHILLGTISGTRRLTKPGEKLDNKTMLEIVYVAMQGENWSPAGEANDYIMGKGLHHTTMCVGDCIRFVDPKRPGYRDTYLCDNDGWKRYET